MTSRAQYRWCCVDMSHDDGCGPVTVGIVVSVRQRGG